MSLKNKRSFYSDADCHNLVDIIYSFKNIIECKKTDAVTWKQKNVTWEKITNLYNAATTESKTVEQLRCKFDNLKKDVRKYEAQKRQSLYKTGGGVEPDIKTALKLLYEKINSIISFSVKGLEPSEGDSDNLVIELLNTDKSNEEHATCSVAVASTSQPLEPEFHVPEMNTQDWSDYTPKMLITKKHSALQIKRSRRNTEEARQKTEMFDLKIKLLEKENTRNEKFHEMKIKKEEELYAYKIKNLALQNQKLELEICILKKQLQNK